MLKEILGEFLIIDGVSAVVMVGRDGLVRESVTSGKMDIDELGKRES